MKEIILNVEGKIYSGDSHSTKWGKGSARTLDKERKHHSSRNTAPLQVLDNKQTS